MFSSHLVAFRSLKKGRLVSSGYYLNYSCPLSNTIYIQDSSSKLSWVSIWKKQFVRGKSPSMFFYLFFLLCLFTTSQTICFNQPDEPGRARMEKPTLTSPLQELASPNQMFDSNVFYLPNMYCKMCAFLPKKQVPKSKQKKILLEDPGINGYLIFAYTVVQLSDVRSFVCISQCLCGHSIACTVESL